MTSTTPRHAPSRLGSRLVRGSRPAQHSAGGVGSAASLKVSRLTRYAQCTAGSTPTLTAGQHSTTVSHRTGATGYAQHPRPHSRAQQTPDSTPAYSGSLTMGQHSRSRRGVRHPPRASLLLAPFPLSTRRCVPSHAALLWGWCLLGRDVAAHIRRRLGVHLSAVRRPPPSQVVTEEEELLQKRIQDLPSSRPIGSTSRSSPTGATNAPSHRSRPTDAFSMLPHRNRSPKTSTGHSAHRPRSVGTD